MLGSLVGIVGFPCFGEPHHPSARARSANFPLDW